MKRKVIQLAGKTYVVTLPTEWVKEWGIKKGEEVDVKESGPRLIVTTGQARDLNRGEVDVNGSSDRSLRWILSSLHKKGYDEFELKTDNPEHSKTVEELLKDLFLGFAIVNKTPKSMTVRAVSRELDEQLSAVTRRAFLVTVQMADDLAKIAKSKKFDELDSVIAQEKTNNQLTNFVQRIINKKGLDEPVKNSFLYAIMWNLEKVADQFKYVGEHMRSKKDVDKNSQVLIERSAKLLREYYELFYNFNVKELSRLSDEFKLLRQDVESELEKSKNPVLLSHLHAAVLKIADFSSSTFALND
jgi:phosphate uptake regulator